MPLEKLILFDWDNTIATGTGQLDVGPFKSAIQSKIADGWYVGLNSDTPLRRLQTWWGNLRMNGPIIAEKGAVVWWPGTQPRVISRTARIFMSLRRKITNVLTQRQGINIFVGDSTHFIRSVDYLACDDSMLVSIDSYRSCSLGIFVRQIEEGKVSLNWESAKGIYEIVCALAPESPLVSIPNLYLEHGFISVNPKDVDKTKGVKALLDLGKPISEVIMIGDSLADFVQIPSVHNFAVGNAEANLKEKADRIAENSYAQGCIELLNLI